MINKNQIELESLMIQALAFDPYLSCYLDNGQLINLLIHPQSSNGDRDRMQGLSVVSRFCGILRLLLVMFFLVVLIMREFLKKRCLLYAL